MSLDGVVTRAIVHELQETIGSRINKIHQPSNHDIVFHMRVRGNNLKLILSANPTYPRVHFTEQTFVNPSEPPMFCMLLRKHCEGGFIERVQQVHMERVIHIDVRQRDELGDEAVKRIIIELTGRHSNIILIDPATNAIIDGIHHLTPAINSYRIVMPGYAYTAPPEQHKDNPLQITKDRFMTLWRESDAETPARWLVNTMSGISPRLADEWSFRLRSAEGTTEEKAWTAFQALILPCQQQQYTPMIVEDQTERVYFSALPLTHIEGSIQTFDSISDCMEAYYGDKAERDMVKQRVGDLSRFLQQELTKNKKKLAKLEDTLQEAAEADQYRIMGELLFGSLHQIRKGDQSIELLNYYDEQQQTIRIALDPLLTPSDNAQRYFKKYNKLKNSKNVVEEQMAAAKEENAYYEVLLQQLENANMQDAQEIREELVEQGLLRNRGRERKQTRRKKKDARPTLYCYTSSEGIPMYVGKNNIQNEYVTNRLAKPNDTWLHTKDIPGSHVVIRSEQFGEKTLEEAAQLSAYFSQAKHSSQVPVDYTLIRYVRKPNGAKPGFVIYDKQKTLYITPDPKIIAALPYQVKQSQ